MSESINHDEAIVLGLIGQFQHSVLRTKIVKLVYLLDQTRHQATGKQTTSFTYSWDNHGPNAQSNAIVRTLEGLANKDSVEMTKSVTPYGNPAYKYKLGQQVDLDNLPLTPDDWVFIKSTFDQFGGMNREQIVGASKQTEPVQQSSQYEELQLTVNPAARRLQQEFSEDVEFMRSTLAGTRHTGTWISWEELKAEIEQDQQIAV